MSMSIRAKIMREEKEPYYIGEVSSSEEEEDAKSSEDELAVFMKRDFQRENENDDRDCSCEDEFEKEMQMELDAVMKSHESANLQQGSFSLCRTEDSNTTSNKLTGSSKQKKDFYDEDYFSSGSDEDENKVGGQASKSDDRRKVLDDVELFYDPEMDDEDEQWVNRQRQKHRQKGNLDSRRKSESTLDTKDQVDSSRPSTVSHTGKVKSSQNSKPEKPLSSDAILSCPACLSMLCIDCQRHEIYNNQYRAMFVMNCHVVDDEVLRYEIPNQIQKPGKKKRKRNQKGKLVAANTSTETESNQPRECYKPVRCMECNTEVAVYDEDEVYHFFNIVASHA